MFARYDYKAGATLANVISDIVKILTGTTDKTTLSADCTQASTSITSTVAAGWTVHDAAAGTNMQVIKAPCLDAAKTKYLRLDFNQAGYLVMIPYETWNATTHVGTNPAYDLTSNWSQRINITSGGTMYIYATAQIVMLLSYTGSWGSISYNGCNIAVEIEDFTTYYTGGVTPFVHFNPSLLGANTGASGMFAPRGKNGTADLTGSSACFMPSSIAAMLHPAYTSMSSLVPNYKVLDAAQNQVIWTTDMYAVQNFVAGGSNGIRPPSKVLGGLLMTVRNLGSLGDDVVDGGTTYFVVGDITYSTRFLVPKA